MKGIALCGFMGCGKTTVANALSNKHGLNHIDTDKYIEEKIGMTISDIFEKYGEEHFRDLEFNTIATLSKENSNVLALGGGAVMHKRNVDILKENGYTLVFIDTDLDVIKKRLLGDTTRPLLKANDIDALYQKRYSTYKDVCDIAISCSDADGEELADLILEIIHKKGKLQ